MPYLDDVLNPYQSLTGDLTPEDTLTGLLTEDGQLQGALAISDVVGVTQLTELTDVSITNPINNDVLTYNDVTEKWENMPAQGGGGGGTSDYNDLTNKPSINSVTLSGNKTTADLNISYNDLDDKPTIPAAQVNSDWNAESGVAEILNKPTIPTKLNQLSDVNYIQPYPKDYLRYDSVANGWKPYGRDDRVEGLSNVLTDTYEVGQVLQLTSITGQHTWRNQKLDYSNIVNTPTIPAAQVNSDWNAASGVAEILNKPTLATVATSGSYNDLTDKPVEATSISVTASSDMPASFPVPDVCRRGKVVIVRFNVNMPARTYLTTETIWNLSKKPVIITNFTITNINGDTIPMLIHSIDGKIRFSSKRTLNAASYFLGELVYLTDED